MDIIGEGIRQKLIRIEDDGKYILYIHHAKRRNYANPEEKVQADSFLNLVLTYKYPIQRIRQFVSVQMGSETKEADIIVYADDDLKIPLPTNTPSTPICIKSAASAGVAMPPAAKFTTGNFPSSATSLTRLIGAPMDFA